MGDPLPTKFLFFIVSRIKVLLPILYLSCSLAIGQSIDFRNLQQKHFRVLEGLPANKVTSMVEDSNGFLWIATSKGIVRFDGNNFVDIPLPPTSKKQISETNYTYKLLYDASTKLIWAGTKRGLFFCQETDYQFQLHNLYHGRQFVSIKDMVLSGGNVFVVGNQGMAKVKSDTTTSEILFDKEHPLFRFATAITDSKNGELWVGTTNGLISLKLDSQKWQHFRYKDQLAPENQIKRLLFHKNQLYYGTWSGGVLSFDIVTREYKTLFDADFSRFYNKGIQDIYIHDDVIYVTSLQGLITENLNDGSYRYYQNEFSKNKVYGFGYIDSAGRIWFGSTASLIQYDGNRQVLNIPLTDRSNFETPLQIEKIIDYKNHVLVAALGSEGLYIINKENYTVEKLELPWVDNDLSLFQISDLEYMFEDKFLVLCDPYLYEFDFNKRHIQRFEQQIDFDAPSLQDAVVDAEGTVYIGSRIGGLHSIDTSAQVRTYRDRLLRLDTLRPPWITNMFLDSRNNLWLNRGSETFLSLHEDSLMYLKEKNKVHFQDVFEMYEDTKGRLWMTGGHQGLGYKQVNQPKDPIQVVKNGYFEKIYALNDSLVWLFGEQAIKLFNLNNFELKNYSFGPPEIQNEIYGPIIDIGNNQYAIGHHKGIYIYDPLRSESDSKPTKIYLNKFYAEGEAFRVNLSLDSSSINLPQGTKSLGLDFNQLSYSEFINGLYYSLGGETIPLQQDLLVNITNLEHGTHTLKIYSDAFQNNSKPELYNLKFTIPTPWYKSTWFISLVLLSLLLLIAYFYSLHIRSIKVKKNNEQLEELNKSKTQFYSNITHEFKTPLTVIMGITKSLKKQLGKKKNNYEHDLEVVERNGQELLQLIDKMLGISKIDSGYFKMRNQASDFILFLKYILESFTYLAKQKRIEIYLETQIESLVFHFDKDVMNTILSNLISNAIKFTAVDGKIYLKVDRPDNELRVIVKDNGLGLTKKDQAKIFNRYYQVDNFKSTEAGNGIGLSLTKSLVERLNGSIVVESQLGEGSSFILTLPLLSEEVISHQQRPVSNLNVDHEQDEKETAPSILIIDDNSDIRYYLKSILQPSYAIIETDTGREGVQMATDLLPDLIITDVMMPGIDGIQVCKLIKTNELTNHIPIIILSAKGKIDDRIKGISTGADAYLAKPFSDLELITIVEQLIDQRQRLISKFKSGSRSFNQVDHILNPASSFLQKVNRSIEKHLDHTDFGVSSLSFDLHLSDSQIYRKIKALTGKSTGIYMRSYRLARAMQLMEQTELNITEISDATGFNDPSWFSRAFKDEFGKSPKALRTD